MSNASGELNVNPDQLFAEIGRLMIANKVLASQLAASRQQLVKQAQQAAESQPEVDPPDEE